MTFEPLIVEMLTPSDRRRLRAAHDLVFATNDPFDYPFQSAVQASMIFYPTDSCWLTAPQYEAIVSAARSVGDTMYFLSLVEHSGDWVEQGQHWSCAFPSYDSYINIQLAAIENALYSPLGNWGALISHEDHAIVGGSVDFIRAVENKYPKWGDEVQELFKLWEGHPNGAWVHKVKGRITTG